MKSMIKLYVHQIPGEAQRICTADMSAYPGQFGALLGVQEIEVEWQEIDANPVDILILHYETEMTRVHDELSERMELIGGRVCDLMRFDHDTGRTFE